MKIWTIVFIDPKKKKSILQFKYKHKRQQIIKANSNKISILLQMPNLEVCYRATVSELYGTGQTNKQNSDKKYQACKPMEQNIGLAPPTHKINK